MYLLYDEFIECVKSAVQKFSQYWLNTEQDNCVSAPPFPPIFIVAGPGTGKTTVLALRVIKLILVDGFDPSSIMATTFTRKAANELRSRILSWGYAIIRQAITNARVENNINRLSWLEKIDINTVLTGTLDSLTSDMISEDRQPGEITPAVIEKFMALGIMRKHIMFNHGRYNNLTLQQHLNLMNPNFPGANSFSQKLSICHNFADRVLHDGIDLQSYASAGVGQQMLRDIVDDYKNYLGSSYLMDFALLEASIIERLLNNRLTSLTDNLKAVLVDEFQDTNYLQEQIYYELVRKSKASFTVVGDDDQSIFRFRGATVEIFANFENRIISQLGSEYAPQRINLVKNYRSSERIVEFSNHFINSETDFQLARAVGKRRCIASANWATDPNKNIPVLGMFRNNVEELSNDLSGFLFDIFQSNGKTISVNNGQTNIIIEKGINGDFGDAILLSRSVSEYNSSGNPRLPLLLRNKLTNRGVNVFNPRGRELSSIQDVSIVLGMMLECIDPNATIQNSITTFRDNTRDKLNDWRQRSIGFISSNPSPGGLQRFISDWQCRGSSSMINWPQDWPVLELLFTLITWIPFFQDNPEGQIYLEVIARTITVAGQISSYHSSIVHNNSIHDSNSVKEAIREIFEPIAEGNVEVDEEIMSYVPRNYFPMMTVHQSKGLEFPIVVVDVGSDFRTNHAAQRRFRYPTAGDNIHFIEDATANYTPVGLTRIARTGQQRAFDDIRRLNFVAMSRAQCVLLLVGLNSQLRTNSPILSIGTGDLFNNMGRSYSFVNSINWVPNSPYQNVALI
jgi:DNA helicase II / ATP-dependent DNA helicase PcrA